MPEAFEFTDANVVGTSRASDLYTIEAAGIRVLQVRPGQPAELLPHPDIRARRAVATRRGALAVPANRLTRSNGVVARHRRAGHTLLHEWAAVVACQTLAALEAGFALSPTSCSRRRACRHAACRRGRRGCEWLGRCVALLSTAVAPPVTLARPVFHGTPVASTVAVRVAAEAGARLSLVPPLLLASAWLGRRPSSLREGCCWRGRGSRGGRWCWSRGRRGSRCLGGCVGLLSTAVAPPVTLACPVYPRTPVPAVAVKVATGAGACLPSVPPLLLAGAWLGRRPCACGRWHGRRWCERRWCERCRRGRWCLDGASAGVVDLDLARLKSFHGREHHICVVASHVGSVLAEPITRAITADVNPPGVLRATNFRDALPNHSCEVANGAAARLTTWQCRAAIHLGVPSIHRRLQTAIPRRQVFAGRACGRRLIVRIGVAQRIQTVHVLLSARICGIRPRDQGHPMHAPTHVVRPQPRLSIGTVVGSLRLPSLRLLSLAPLLLLLLLQQQKRR